MGHSSKAVFNGNNYKDFGHEYEKSTLKIKLAFAKLYSAGDIYFMCMVLFADVNLDICKFISKTDLIKFSLHLLKPLVGAIRKRGLLSSKIIFINV